MSKIISNTNTNNDSDSDSKLDSLLSMVDLGDSNSKVTAPITDANAASISNVPNPSGSVSGSVFEEFQKLCESYKDSVAAGDSILGKITSTGKYTLLFSAFVNKHQRAIKKDSLGQYIRIGTNKLRPRNQKGQAFFFQAISYRME
jgi:hypothetical protein